MSVFARTTTLALIGLGMLCTGAQAQNQPRFVVDYCVKVKPGRGADYAALLRDVSAKMAQVGIDEGKVAAYSVAQAVSPAGSSARCDYHLYYTFDGWPPEPPTPEQTEATMKKAGLSITREQMLARRREDASLVSAEIWQARAGVGQGQKGSYARLNFYKVKPGMTADWIRLETEGWKALVEKAHEDNPGIAWGAATLVMPGGSSLEHNAITFDSFPDWAAYGKGISVRANWIKAHPNQDLSAYLDRVNSIIDRPRVDVVKMVEVLRKK